MPNRLIISERVAYRRIDSDYALVLENNDNPEILLLEAESAAIFDRLAAGWTVEETIADAVRAIPGVDPSTVTDDIQQFISELKSLNIVSVSEAQNALIRDINDSVDAISWLDHWSAPALSAREPVTVLAGFCTLAPSVCRGYGQRPVRSSM
ncbi:MAG: PqqD family protein [Planctomycetota bacterium]